METKKFVSFEKLSKKEQRRRNAEKRGSWNGVNPVSRIVPNKKAYDRRREKRVGLGYQSDPSFLFLHICFDIFFEFCVCDI